MDIFLRDAVVDGVLLGSVLALLALGLNLVFGVIDVVWISYAELVMCGMYAIYWLFTFFHWPLLLACLVAILGVALLGLLVHLLIIELDCEFNCAGQQNRQRRVPPDAAAESGIPAVAPAGPATADFRHPWRLAAIGVQQAFAR